MEELLLILREISVLILPILGAAILIFLLVLLKNVLDILKQTSATIAHVEKTLGVVDEAIDDVQASLKTVRAITNGIDMAGALASQSITKLAKLLVENYDSIKTWFLKLFNRFEPTGNESVYEPDEGESI